MSKKRQEAALIESSDDEDEDDVVDYASSEEEKTPKIERVKPDLAKIFKLKNAEDVVYADCVKKLNSDDVSMIRQLIQKYADDYKVTIIFNNVQMPVKQDRTLFTGYVKRFIEISVKHLFSSFFQSYLFHFFLFTIG